jgi:Carboxypeptidase regulatory-like domain
MRVTNVCSIFLACAAISISAWAQKGSNDKPSVFLENNRPSNPKDTNTRIVSGFVKDQNDNPIPGAIVQLKNLKTSKVIDFPTKEDGRFTFRDLRMGDDYELIAKHDQLASPAKKVTVYDTRKNIVLTFKLEPPAKEGQE